ncbi:VOC family protein [Geomicrobium sp. JCM 19039]|uniref:VOC family protein n=1 Tax=Geomicrobium sp. JCM 19039 TaxID=1460636 RepID=UPI00045F3E4D|nr:VOC family protein [Geomicrobium sp. JCM 19039]GAK13558.1 PhnB protein [Geomicrobium sp. JCM 19039]
MKQMLPFFMFQEGIAEEAMNHYVSVFKDAKIQAIERYGPDGPGEEGTVLRARFMVKDQEFMCIDSHIQHDFTFTPSISMYITCENEEEIDHLYTELKEGGNELMPIGDYGFSQKFAWVNDRFGVSWQLNLK